MVKKILFFLPLLFFLFVAADYQTVTESFGSIVVGRDTLQVFSGEKDTSRVFVQDKYNNKIVSFIFDDATNTSNNSGDQYNFKIYALQAVAAYDNENKLFLTPSHCADSVIVSAISPDSLNCDTTHYTSKGLFYHSFQMDYSRGVAFVIQGLAGTRATGTRPKAYMMVSQRKRL